MTETGIMLGFPIPPGGRVPRQDWDSAPWNRWAFQHIREILPTVEVWRGRGPVWALTSRPRTSDDLSFNGPRPAGRPLCRLADSSFSDGFIVLHGGEIVYERYLNGMTERTLHLSQSMAKSITAPLPACWSGAACSTPKPGHRLSARTETYRLARRQAAPCPRHDHGREVSSRTTRPSTPISPIPTSPPAGSCRAAARRARPAFGTRS